ncbi:hypothetical protein MUK42_34603 [Musa troglodytarum]|uniref:Uncharacterized protein n=1 Tax=Musa troglodytarum TaxID=320322 RepID=A0A9E7E9U4_9LILI|nr:hypothetical protein MUK42_34603 [Musa troglodytarum]
MTVDGRCKACKGCVLISLPREASRALQMTCWRTISQAVHGGGPPNAVVLLGPKVPTVPFTKGKVKELLSSVVPELHHFFVSSSDRGVDVEKKLGMAWADGKEGCGGPDHKKSTTRRCEEEEEEGEAEEEAKATCGGFSNTANRPMRCPPSLCCLLPSSLLHAAVADGPREHGMFFLEQSWSPGNMTSVEAAVAVVEVVFAVPTHPDYHYEQLIRLGAVMADQLENDSAAILLKSEDHQLASTEFFPENPVGSRVQSSGQNPKGVVHCLENLAFLLELEKALILTPLLAHLLAPAVCV